MGYLNYKDNLHLKQLSKRIGALARCLQSITKEHFMASLF
jgi:hypothetical protein